MRVLLLALVLCACTPVHVQQSAHLLLNTMRVLVPLSRTVYEETQMLAARTACGNATPCAAHDEATAAVRVIREQWAPVWNLSATDADARVDAWIEEQRKAQRAPPP